MDQQTEQIAAQQQLTALANLIGESNPALVAHMQQQQQATRQVETKRLLDLYPTWADPDVKKAAAPALLKAAQVLGFSETEFAFISDHRQVRALEMLSRYMQREEDGKAKAEAFKAELPKSQKSKQRKQSASQKKSDLIKRAKGGSNDDKQAAISALIRG
jgi:hypothetical protein